MILILTLVYLHLSLVMNSVRIILATLPSIARLSIKYSGFKIYKSMCFANVVKVVVNDLTEWNGRFSEKWMSCRVKCDEKPSEIAIKTDQLHQRMCEQKINWKECCAHLLLFQVPNIQEITSELYLLVCCDCSLISRVVFDIFSFAFLILLISLVLCMFFNKNLSHSIS